MESRSKSPPRMKSNHRMISAPKPYTGNIGEAKNPLFINFFSMMEKKETSITHPKKPETVNMNTNS
jgi:hypothetical protein